MVGILSTHRQCCEFLWQIFRHPRFKLPNIQGYLGAGSIVVLGTILSETCRRSADTAVDLDGRIRVCPVITIKVDKLCRLPTPLTRHAVSGELVTDHTRRYSVLLSDTINRNSRETTIATATP